MTVLRTLHSYAPARALAKRLLKGRLTLTQKFHRGVICLDAVEHSWAWVGECRYESFDRDVQDSLTELSRGYDRFIDIGCNVGAMTLAVLLRNENIDALCVDPNRRAVSLLNRSLVRNALGARAHVLCAVVGEESSTLCFDPTGSVIGHVSSHGIPTTSIAFGSLLNEQLKSRRCLVKVDVEGFETLLLPHLREVEELDRCCLVVELHPKGWNDLGDPEVCVETLRATGARLTMLLGGDVALPASGFSQLVATWPSS